MKSAQLAVLAACLCVVSADLYLPKKLVKKYAMKMIAEDCFGEQVLSALRQEMHAARVKCIGHQPEALPAADVLITSDDDTLTRRRRTARGARHFGPDRLRALHAKITAFFGNATCVLRELKMLDADNQVDLSSMRERLANMPVDAALKGDLDHALEACHQFAACLPESVVSKPAMMGFTRQSIFFKCFKEAKLESCMKKTFREDYLPMLIEENIPVDEEESFYTIITGAIVDEKRDYF